MLPCTSSTGTPSSGPLTKQWVRMRLVSTITLSMPGLLGRLGDP